MIKKHLFKLSIFIIILMIIISGIILHSKNIPIIKNMKKSILKQTDANTISEVTTIDVTGIKTGKDIEHKHILKNQYDDISHWNYCIICGEIQDKVNHTYKTTWALGTESCNWNNSYTKTCTCGYSETGHKPCVWDGTTYTRVNWFHYKPCSVCNSSIEHAYYLKTYGKGEIYTENSREPCKKSNGDIINCKNLGTCAKCQTQFTNKRHVLKMKNNTGKIVCGFCNDEFGTFTINITKDSNVPATYTFVANCELTNGATFLQTSRMREATGDKITWETNTQKVTNLNSSKTQFTIITTAKFKSSIKEPYETYTVTVVSINGLNCNLTTEWDEFNIKGYTAYPDSIKPEILKISSNTGESLVEWSKSKTIVVEGTENYCDIVKIKIIDEEENIIFSEKTTVNNGKYSISCEPELEASTEGRKFKVIVTDTCENTAEKEFTIAKVDSIAPEVTSENKIDGGWAKEKNFKFIAIDHGIGNVQIAFNDVSNYSLATKKGEEYSREYKFVGDIYTETKAMVFYKDELGNTTSQEITINKLDNTAPTITSASIQNNKLNITSNDIKEGLGEGSGVTKYRYITSTTKLENPKITSENSTEVNSNDTISIPEIYKVKYVYIVAEDLVGNRSEIYEVEVPQLELTSKVNTSNKKGGVELDWSNYDISDKYFVIYRKQENETNWETIITLEQKYTGSSYIDKAANDKSKPNTPNINIQENSEKNNIEISSESTDNGTKYSYYIESYDSTNLSLLNTSNQEKS